MLNSNNILGFHSALPLEVHGSGYNQMQMISNSKVKISLVKIMDPDITRCR